MATTLPLTIAIPTYRREDVLLKTVADLLALEPRAAEILLIDQTPQHQPATESRLGQWNASADIRWIRRAAASIPGAMNDALMLATQDLVLFVDDDVRPQPELLLAHVKAHAIDTTVLVAGRVIQPWEEGLAPQLATGFASTQAGDVREFIGCNFSVPRGQALALGGFDENFVSVAYRFEAEFAHRWLGAGGRIRFVPEACLHHLKELEGGTRSFGDHRTTWRGDHAVGAYYWALRTGSWREFARRPWRAVATRFHLARPWRIPPTIAAELGGMLWAIKLHRSGPKRRPASTSKP